MPALAQKRSIRPNSSGRRRSGDHRPRPNVARYRQTFDLLGDAGGTGRVHVGDNHRGALGGESRHNARPMPDAPPVTTATFPANSIPGVSRYGRRPSWAASSGDSPGVGTDHALHPEGAADAVEVDPVDGDEVAPDGSKWSRLGLVGAAGVDGERTSTRWRRWIRPRGPACRSFGRRGSCGGGRRGPAGPTSPRFPEEVVVDRQHVGAQRYHLGGAHRRPRPPDRRRLGGSGLAAAGERGVANPWIFTPSDRRRCRRAAPRWGCSRWLAGSRASRGCRGLEVGNRHLRDELAQAPSIGAPNDVRSPVSQVADLEPVGKRPANSRPSGLEWMSLMCRMRTSSPPTVPPPWLLATEYSSAT